MKADNELLKNSDKLHTTELGIERIKRNLNIDSCILTVNAYSYTIITAN